MDELRGYLHNVKEFSDVPWINGNQKWVQLYPYGSWTHPLFSDTTIDRSVADTLVKNFDDRVMGRDIVVEYDHGLDKAKGGKAAGKVVKQEARDDGLYGLVEFNDVAKQEIDNGEWHYMSNSHWDTWTNPQTQQTHEFVPENPSLTNRPYVRGMSPINFSEVVIDNEPKEFADWTTAYKNSLPDSAFLWVESGHKDAEGKTVPRSLRHLPYKDASGKIDIGHLRKAVQLAPKLSKGDKAGLQAKARALLAKQHSDTLIADDEYTELLELVDELDNKEGGETVVTDEEFQITLREKLGLGVDITGDALVTHIAGMNDELGPLRELKKEHSEAKKFSELYPDQARELEELKVRDRENFAKQFSDTLAQSRIVRKTKKEGSDEPVITPTGLGFSALALEKITEQVKSFSEGSATLEGFKGVLDAIVDDGIVDYGTHGSSRDVDLPDDDKKPTNHTDARKMFSDKVDAIVEADKLEYTAAYAKAAVDHPELFEAYKTYKPVATNA